MYMNVRQDVSYLFAGMRRDTSKVAGNNFLGEYASIKNGSYAKLMKAYYSEMGNEAVNGLVQGTNATREEDLKVIAKVQGSTDALKESADALWEKGEDSVFSQKEGKYDVEAIYDAVETFVRDYNAVVDATGASNHDAIERNALNMVNTCIQNGRLLGRVGISLGEDGKLALDEETFREMEMSTVQSLFQGNGSFAYQLSARASMINYAADREATKGSMYTDMGSYHHGFTAGNVFNMYF